MQAPDGLQSLNAGNQRRVPGRWMHMVRIPIPFSVAKASQKPDRAARMKPSSFDDHVVDMIEELVKFTLLARDIILPGRSLFRAKGKRQGFGAADEPGDSDLASIVTT